MSIESALDLEGMRAAADVVRRALEAMRRALRPGLRTAELDGIAEDVLRASGAESAPQVYYGFPGVTCISVNDEIVHGVPSLSRVIAAGDVVKLDVTVRKNGYVADAARTVAVPPVPVDVARLIDGVEKAFAAAMRAARAGAPVRAIGRAVESDAIGRGFTVVRRLCGHGVGRAIHEEPTVPNVDDPGTTGTLTRGLVLAVEPMLTHACADVRESDDGWTILTRDGSVAVHHEQTIVITDAEPMILTA